MDGRDKEGENNNNKVGGKEAAKTVWTRDVATKNKKEGKRRQRGGAFTSLTAV